jgi:hypothetical protein
MKIRIIQIQRMGDLIITLPIAAWFIRQGHEVYWPVHEVYYDAIRRVAPDVKFMPLDPDGCTDPLEFLYRRPYAFLSELGCERIIPLNSSLEGADFIDRKLALALKFDEYKYAHARVPFTEKWNLQLHRDAEREMALHRRLPITGPYICVHDTASDVSAPVHLPASWLARYQIIQVQELTDSLFDWIYTIERADKLVMIDSSLANLTEQLNIESEKYLIIRSVAAATPVYKNGWTFCWPFDPIPDSPDRLQKNLLKAPGTA